MPPQPTPSPLHPPLPTGASLDGGRYRVLALAGGGGMSHVYQAEVVGKPGRIVAIKAVHLDGVAGMAPEQVAALFRQEVTLLARSVHPHLPRLYAAFEQDGRSYLVMEFIDGWPLDQVLKSTADAHGGRGLDERQALAWMLPICEALDYLHRQPQPIIFRDLKPGNIMVDRQGVVKLIDLGIARTFKQGQTKDTITVGTEGYAAPEAYPTAWSQQTDARSDVYSVGATLFHLLTGQSPPNPFDAAGGPRSPRQVNPAISAATSEVVETALRFDPAARHASVVEMRDALARCLAALELPRRSSCPNCRFTVQPGDSFCAHCGKHLGGEIRGLLQIIGRSEWWPVGPGPCVVGRSSIEGGTRPELDLAALDREHVSRRHACIEAATGGFVVTDLNSTNGTWINGRRIPALAPQVLRSGDRLGIGEVELVFRVTG